MKRNAIFAAILLAAAFSAHAGQPAYTPAHNPVNQVRTQVPGYFRQMVGDFEVTALYDGFLSADPKLFQPYSQRSLADLNKLLDDSFRLREADGGVNTAVIGFLVNTGKNLIMLDAGVGGVEIMGKNAGRLVGSLKAAGYEPGQVDLLIPTHMHFDHISGLTRNGKRVFPKATLLLAVEEKGFWLDKNVNSLPEPVRGLAILAREAVAPYAKAGKVHFYRSGEEVVPGMRSRPSPGHTPGHNGIEFSSKGQTMLVWGDLMHNHTLQMLDPEIAIEFDSDPRQARISRLAALKDAAERKIWVAGAHMPFPGIGHIRAEGNGRYTWLPAEYAPIERR